jgi:O-antigen ligase
MDDRLRRGLLGAFLAGLAVSISLAQAALALLAARWLWRLATGRARHPWPLALPFLAFAGASLLAAVLSARPLESLAALRGLLLIVTVYVALDALPDARAAERALMALLALTAAVSVLGVLQVALCPWLPELPFPFTRLARRCHRAHGFYSIYMTLAGVLSLVLLATGPRLLAGRASRWPAAAWLLDGLGFVFTYVRGAWLGFLVGVAVVLGLVRRGRVVVVGAVLVLALVVLLVPGVRRRAESIVDPDDPTARDRWSMWGSGLAMARERPVTGIGPGQVKHEYRRYAAPEALQQSRGHLHNTPLQILVERGLLGLATWAWIFAAFFLRAGRLLGAAPGPGERALVAGSLAAVAGFLAGGLTEYNFGDSEVVLVAYLVMAVPFAVAPRPGQAS